MQDVKLVHNCMIKIKMQEKKYAGAEDKNN